MSESVKFPLHTTLVMSIIICLLVTFLNGQKIIFETVFLC